MAIKEFLKGILGSSRKSPSVQGAAKASTAVPTPRTGAAAPLQRRASQSLKMPLGPQRATAVPAVSLPEAPDQAREAPEGIADQALPASPASLPPPATSAGRRAARFGGGETVAEQDSRAATDPSVQVTAPDRTSTALSPATDSPPTRRRLVEADAAKISELLAYAGEVPTVEGGAFSGHLKNLLSVAYLVDGTLLVDKNNPLSPESMELREKLKRAGRQVRAEYSVELEIIRKIHEAAHRRSSQGRAGRNRGQETLQQMQHEVLDLVAEAAKIRASDIHVFVRRYEAQIRMRSDGLVETIRQREAAWANELCAAAFNMADASDATYRMLECQGARISEVRVNLPVGVQALRLQFNPLPNGGRYMIMRLLYSESDADANGDVDTLGYAPVQVRQIHEMRGRTEGVNIISGPTGSGKSTTLMVLLTADMRHNEYRETVQTIEDPPEYVIPGAAQIPVLNASTDEERREKFRGVIVSVLRSDPDVIMVGEVRDGASASLLLQAGMTGHRVWASLHANSAIGILDRLRDMQVEQYKLTDHDLMTGLIGQRLIRKLCPKCKLDYDTAVERGIAFQEHVTCGIGLVRATYPGARICVANPTPPKDCGCKGGEKGREVIAETIRPDARFMDIYRSGAKQEAIAYWLSDLDGMSMQEHAIQKMATGTLDPREVERRINGFSKMDEARLPHVFGPVLFAPPAPVPTGGKA